MAAGWHRPAGAVTQEGQPPVPGRAPVNPFALTELLVGGPVPAGAAGEAMVSRVLGAPLPALLTPGSVLYRPGAFLKKATKSAGGIKASGIKASGIKADLTARVLAGGPASVALVQKAPPGSLPGAKDQESDWLRATGYTCLEWSRLSARERLSAVAGLPGAPEAHETADRITAWCDSRPPGYVPTGDTEYRDQGIPGRIAERLGFPPDRHDPAACAAWMNLSRDEQIARIQRAFPLELAAIRRGEGIRTGLSVNPTNPEFAATVRYFIQTYGLSEAGMTPAVADRRTQLMLAAARYTACDGANPPGSNFTLDVPGGPGSPPRSYRAAWVRLGNFLPSGGLPSVLDPVQGIVGDCFLISTFAGLVWAMPNALERLVGRSGDRFTVTLRNRAVTVSSRVPCMIQGGYSPLFCRPDRPDAWWPAVLEKAWAEWVTGDSTDRPDLMQLDNLDASSAIRQQTPTYSGVSMTIPMVDLLGARPFWNQLVTRGAEGCFNLVNEFCTEGKADRGILTAASSPEAVYGTVPKHAYTVLGTLTGTDGRRAIVVRNPWGRFVPRRATDPGAVVPFNGRWHGLDVSGEYHGVAALDAGFFANVFTWLYGVRL